ncbi:MAG: ABC transporter ATP-binding protein [Scardovia wiggsiae]|nr:ABC transporter ATP-binding protein [Scardovia wiggsiae]
MIEFRNVCKQFDDTAVINNESFTINTGEFFVLVGPSGGGKTTTLKMINRLVEPTSGSILIDGEDITSLPLRDLRLETGYVLQQIALFPNMTVGQNIGLIPEMKGWSKADRAEKARNLLKRVDLDPETYYGRYPDELSGGEQQRIGILRALIASPKVILMDEPFSALDPITRVQLQDLTLDLHDDLGTTIVFVTHDINEAQYLADRICVINDGRVTQTGTPDEIRENPADDFVRDLFHHTRRRKH